MNMNMKGISIKVKQLILFLAILYEANYAQLRNRNLIPLQELFQ